MTRSTVNPLGRLLVALSLTAAAMFGSVAVAATASADDVVSAESTAAPSEGDPAAAQEADQAAAKAAEKAAKAAEKAAKDAEKAAKAAKDAKDAKDAVKQEEVTYEGDRVGRISAALHARNERWGSVFDRFVSVVRVKVADYLVSKGRQVAFDQRGRLIVAPAVCDPAKPSWTQRNCVQPIEGGGRY